MSQPNLTQSVTFGPDADGFAKVLGDLADQRLAVRVTLASGREVDAVIILANDGLLLYEPWAPGAGGPSGDTDTVPIADIASIYVF